MNPLVSAIIPVYNHAAFVLTAVESVLSQTFKCDELIVINDGSSDNSAEVLKPYLESGKVIYVEQQNLGQAVARNHGLAMARGKYVGFLDDDDAWEVGKTERQVEYLERNPSCVAVGGRISAVNTQGLSLGDWKHAGGSFTFRDVFRECPFSSPGQTLIRRDALAAVGGMDTGLWGTDDWDLWFRLSYKGNVVRTEDISLSYRIHDGNASRDSARMARNALRVINRHLPSLPVTDRDAARREAMRWTYAQFARRAFQLGIKRLVRGHIRELAGLVPILPYARFRFATAIREL